MLKPRGLEITNDLCLMFRSWSPGCFEFNDQDIFDEQVGGIISYYSPILVKHANWMLLFYVDSDFGQTVRQCVFINFLEVAMAMVEVDLVGDLSNLIRQFVNISHSFPFDFCVLCVLCG